MKNVLLLICEVAEILPVAPVHLVLTVRPWKVEDAAGFENIFAALSWN